MKIKTNPAPSHELEALHHMPALGPPPVLTLTFTLPAPLQHDLTPHALLFYVSRLSHALLPVFPTSLPVSISPNLA